MNILLKFLGMPNGIIARKNIKITFLTDAPFIVKFRFEKYRYLLTHLLCLQIFEVLLSDKHSTGPRNGRLVPLPVACLVWWYSFRPQIYDESETDQILNAKYFVWKNYTLGKWGLREAFNQNSLMQLFNGDRRIVHCDCYSWSNGISSCDYHCLSIETICYIKYWNDDTRSQQSREFLIPYTCFLII